MVHIWGVLDRAAERAVVLEGRATDAYGRIPLVHISGPGNPIPKCACCGWVLERLIMENLRKQHQEDRVNAASAVMRQN